LVRRTIREAGDKTEAGFFEGETLAHCAPAKPPNSSAWAYRGIASKSYGRSGVSDLMRVQVQRLDDRKRAVRRDAMARCYLLRHPPQRSARSPERRATARVSAWIFGHDAGVVAGSRD
jgi:hypothetical protein